MPLTPSPRFHRIPLNSIRVSTLATVTGAAVPGSWSPSPSLPPSSVCRILTSTPRHPTSLQPTFTHPNPRARDNGAIRRAGPSPSAVRRLWKAAPALWGSCVPIWSSNQAPLVPALGCVNQRAPSYSGWRAGPALCPRFVPASKGSDRPAFPYVIPSLSLITSAFVSSSCSRILGALPGNPGCKEIGLRSRVLLL